MSYLNDLKNDTNYIHTENGAVAHKSTMNAVLDLFSMGGAYRNRTDAEVEALFGDAYRQNRDLALKCLFYLRDVRGGQGERRFFRVAYKWLIRNDINTASMNAVRIPEFGRWDDLIDICFDTELEGRMITIVYNQLESDCNSDYPSLLAKWMPSENASNAVTKARARRFIREFDWTPKVYRKTLSKLRERINVLESIMSGKEWDEIDFSAIPSVAGMKYRHCFSTREELRDRYAEFMGNKKTKVNASVLNPVDIAEKVITRRYSRFTQTEIDTLQKYWDNLKDYYHGREENAIAVVDVSGSMLGLPMAAAVGMGAYIADKSKGRFANHFITFSAHPQLVEFNGSNIVEKICRCINADWGYNTNIERVMDLLLDTALEHRTPQSEMPARLYIFSDMEFDKGLSFGRNYDEDHPWRCPAKFGDREDYKTLFEQIERKWAAAGYKMPKITFWNLDARQNNIPAIGDNFNYISGFSMSQMESVMAGKSAVDLMLDVLLKDRYKFIKAWY